VLANAHQLVWLEPPQPNGGITVVDVVKTSNFEEHEKLVEQWASNVWAAWVRHHETIKHLAVRCANRVCEPVGNSTFFIRRTS
jgi:hypothetical protein